jgi:hypothetical protein
LYRMDICFQLLMRLYKDYFMSNNTVNLVTGDGNQKLYKLKAFKFIQKALGDSQFQYSLYRKLYNRLWTRYKDAIITLSHEPKKLKTKDLLKVVRIFLSGVQPSEVRNKADEVDKPKYLQGYKDDWPGLDYLEVECGINPTFLSQLVLDSKGPQMNFAPAFHAEMVAFRNEITTKSPREPYATDLDVIRAVDAVVSERTSKRPLPGFMQYSCMVSCMITTENEPTPDHREQLKKVMGIMLHKALYGTEWNLLDQVADPASGSGVGDDTGIAVVDHEEASAGTKKGKGKGIPAKDKAPVFTGVIDQVLPKSGYQNMDSVTTWQPLEEARCPEDMIRAINKALNACVGIKNVLGVQEFPEEVLMHKPDVWSGVMMVPVEKTEGLHTPENVVRTYFKLPEDTSGCGGVYVPNPKHKSKDIITEEQVYLMDSANALQLAINSTVKYCGKFADGYDLTYYAQPTPSDTMVPVIQSSKNGITIGEKVIPYSLPPRRPDRSFLTALQKKLPETGATPRKRTKTTRTRVRLGGDVGMAVVSTDRDPPNLGDPVPPNPTPEQINDPELSTDNARVFVNNIDQRKTIKFFTGWFGYVGFEIPLVGDTSVFVAFGFFDNEIKKVTPMRLDTGRGYCYEKLAGGSSSWGLRLGWVFDPYRKLFVRVNPEELPPDIDGFVSFTHNAVQYDTLIPVYHPTNTVMFEEMQQLMPTTGGVRHKHRAPLSRRWNV